MIHLSDVSDLSRSRIEGLYPGLQPTVFKVLNDIYSRLGRTANIAQGYRSFNDQLECYEKGRELQGGRWVIIDPKSIVTNAKPGLSWHCYGLALDISWAGLDPYLEKEKEEQRENAWQVYANVGKSYGFKWGGDFHLMNGVRDLPHLEFTYGLTISQAVELYEQGGIKGVWKFLDKILGLTL